MTRLCRIYIFNQVAGHLNVFAAVIRDIGPSGPSESPPRTTLLEWPLIGCKTRCSLVLLLILTIVICFKFKTLTLCWWLTPSAGIQHLSSYCQLLFGEKWTEPNYYLLKLQILKKLKSLFRRIISPNQCQSIQHQ